MSRVRVHIVGEGPTDSVVIEAILDYYLDDYVSTQIQPERSLLGGDQGPFGGGWKGVRSWCQQIGLQGGLVASRRLKNAELLVIHLDADVADDDEVACAKPCPPPSATVDELRSVVWTWLGEKSLPHRALLCIPSKTTEAWILAGLHPDDPRVVPCDPPPERQLCLECRDTPAFLLVGKPTKLVRRKQGTLKKDNTAYRRQQPRLSRAWPRILETCTEARRFDSELRAALQQVRVLERRPS